MQVQETRQKHLGPQELSQQLFLSRGPADYRPLVKLHTGQIAIITVDGEIIDLLTETKKIFAARALVPLHANFYCNSRRRCVG